MTEWLNDVETILTRIETETGIPFNFERFEGELSQLPDAHITYFLVDDVGTSHFDGKEYSHEPRIQISLFYRDKTTALTIPDKIVKAFLNAGFTRVSEGKIPYQKDTQHYGWRVDFKIYIKRGN